MLVARRKTDTQHPPDNNGSKTNKHGVLQNKETSIEIRESKNETSSISKEIPTQKEKKKKENHYHADAIALEKLSKVINNQHRIEDLVERG